MWNFYLLDRDIYKNVNIIYIIVNRIVIVGNN